MCALSVVLMVFTQQVVTLHNKYDNGPPVKTHINIREQDKVTHSHAGHREYVTRQENSMTLVLIRHH